MSRCKHVRTLCAGVLSLGLADGAAVAADLTYKAPPPKPVFDQLDVHGFFDLTFSNDYMTPRGLLVTRTGLTTQALMGLSLDIYKNQGAFLSSISVDFGTWNDLWSKQDLPSVGSWNEMDWWVGANAKFANYWTFGVHYWEFLPPAHGLPTTFPSTERNVEFALSYNDFGPVGPSRSILTPNYGITRQAHRTWCLVNIMISTTSKSAWCRRST